LPPLWLPPMMAPTALPMPAPVAVRRCVSDMPAQAESPKAATAAMRAAWRRRAAAVMATALVLLFWDWEVVIWISIRYICLRQSASDLQDSGCTGHPAAAARPSSPWIVRRSTRTAIESCSHHIIRWKPMRNVFSFSAGPAVLPEEVLAEAAAEMLDWHGSGQSVMEMSHRGKEYMAIHAQAEADLRELMAIPPNYKTLFLQGGATLQFAILPMNFLPEGRTADYVNTGEWSKKAIKEARLFGKVNVAASSKTVGSPACRLATSGG
jgi:hypothetical protein